MHESITATIARAERVTFALRALCELPVAEPFHFNGDDLQTNLVQFFPVAHKRPQGWRNEAKSFARAIGGRWQGFGGTWECQHPLFPGLERTKICIHYVEPESKETPAFISLEDSP